MAVATCIVGASACSHHGGSSTPTATPLPPNTSLRVTVTDFEPYQAAVAYDLRLLENASQEVWCTSGLTPDTAGANLTLSDADILAYGQAYTVELVITTGSGTALDPATDSTFSVPVIGTSLTIQASGASVDTKQAITWVAGEGCPGT